MNNYSSHTFVLLHGWGASSQKLEPLKASLLECMPQADVVALDLPGFNESLESPWNLAQYAQWLNEQIHQYQKVVLIGHSFGGQVIAKLLTTTAVENVESSVFIAAAAVRRPVTIKQFIRRSVASLARFARVLPFLNSLKSRLRSPDYQKASPTMRKTMQMALNEDLTDDLTTITIPTLVVWGELDQQTPIEAARLMAQKLPNATMVTFPSRGHDVVYTEPGWIASQVQSFLSTIKA